MYLGTSIMITDEVEPLFWTASCNCLLIRKGGGRPTLVDRTNLQVIRQVEREKERYTEIGKYLSAQVPRWIGAEKNNLH